ncbi:MAG: hypothetical protein ACE3JQ_08120 [Paenisporosarcina sp.]
MKRLKIVLPIMLIVAVLAMWFLEKDYASIPLKTRFLIAAGGALVSGVISYFLLHQEVERIVPKPPKNKE